jgi:hypothetical protein
LVYGQGSKIAHPANAWLAIRIVQESHGVKIFLSQGTWLVRRPQPSLLLHHLDFGSECLLAEQEVLHAIRFEGKTERQLALLEALKVGGVILTGKGVLLPTMLGHEPRERPSWVLRCSLEHQVLEHMGDPRDPAVLVTRTNFVPDLRDNHGGTMIFLHQELEPVV